MSAAASIQLTSAQDLSIKQYLAEIDSQIVIRAISLSRERAIRSITATGNGATAKIQGTLLYTTKVQFIDEQISGECSCPYEGTCKHIAALLIVLRKEATITQAPSHQPPPNSPRKTQPEPPFTPFEVWIKNKLGQTPPPRIHAMIQALEGLWLQQTREVHQSAFLQIFGIRTWGYQYLELWPKEYPPTNEAEFFAYLFLTLKACHQVLPSPLDQLADPQLVKHLQEQRQHLKLIIEWKSKLQQWEETPNVVPTEYLLRLQLHDRGATIQISTDRGLSYTNATQKRLKEINHALDDDHKKIVLGMGSVIVLNTSEDGYSGGAKPDIRALSRSLANGLFQLFSHPELFPSHVVNEEDSPLKIIEAPLKWVLRQPSQQETNYQILLQTTDNKAVPEPLAILPTQTIRYITSQCVYSVPNWPFKQSLTLPIEVPAEALESSEGVRALALLNLEPPAHVALKVLTLEPAITVHCSIHRPPHSQSDYLRVKATANLAPHAPDFTWTNQQWRQDSRPSITATEGQITHIKKATLMETAGWLSQLSLRPVDTGIFHETRIVTKNWPEIFTEWMASRPNNIHVLLDPELQSIKEGVVGGKVRLAVEESENRMDWFDLRASIQVNDLTLTQEEIELLLKAKGKWVKLSDKGWRKLDFEITPEQQAELDELGLSLQQFTGEKQQLHALQLGALAKDKNGLLPTEHAQKLQRRLEDIHTQVTPDQPAEIQATLRPYQTQGFHFLSYLSTNRFGGILADDMGLGKTLQTLTWIAWLRTQQKVSQPVLVICPKSVQDNWRAEAERFYPDLKVTVWDRNSAGKTGLDGSTDLLVIHYPQLRIHEATLQEQFWSAVILDEAQAIKNPTSQNNKAACALKAQYRLALTGTPIENRLMDLWAIFAFAMPGALGNRASFNRLFNATEDPQARRRLAARTKPFLLRRTKKEVATDLPDRVEEDLVVEMEGTQAALYQAEIKRARAQLLKVQTSTQLDKARFSILTSLLRLRQICCHPRLVGLDQDVTESRTKKKKFVSDDNGESAKLTALLEQLEPIIEEGQKVLVFSQFVEMLNLIQDEITKQNWKVFILTGSTDDRGALVKEFQEYDGSAVFLISLKAGGFGLNLTAASYVVLYDPWWNPAVEAQAIDRTHRIGQKQTVFAYRLIIKDSIEEKIRLLQKQKGALAYDILGEESFSQGLTLSDFQFLLG